VSDVEQHTHTHARTHAHADTDTDRQTEHALFTAGGGSLLSPTALPLPHRISNPTLSTSIHIRGYVAECDRPDKSLERACYNSASNVEQAKADGD
jgi:hypothetical protein